MKKEIKKEKQELKRPIKEYSVFCAGKLTNVLGDDYIVEKIGDGSCVLSLYLKEDLVGYFMGATHFIINKVADYQEEDLENTRPKDFGKVDGCVF